MGWSEVSIAGGSSATGWSPIGEDLLYDSTARPSALLRKRGPAAIYDTFDDGHGSGWRNHFSGNRPLVPYSLVSYPTMHGSGALRVSPGDLPLGQATNWESGGAFRNISKFRDTGLVSVSMYFAWAGDGSYTTADFPFSTLDFMLDTQKWDNSSRSFYRFSYVVQAAPSMPIWKIKNDAGSNVTITGSDFTTAGGNERKVNWNYLRYTIDQDANGGLGGYHELQVNNHLYDLRSLGAGRGADTTISGSSWNNFSGGTNVGIAANRSTANPSFTNLELIIDEVVVTFDDVRAS